MKAKTTALHLRMVSDIPNDKEYVEALDQEGNIVFDVGLSESNELEILFDDASAGMLIGWTYFEQLIKTARTKLDKSRDRNDRACRRVKSRPKDRKKRRVDLLP